MSSVPNRFNSYVEDTTNHHRGFVQMNNNSSVIRSMFSTYDETNLFSSSSPSFTTTGYQNSHVSSSLSSFGFNGSQMMMRRRNIDSGIVSVSNLTPLRDHNPHLTQISFTETITKRYSALVPTNTISSFQNDFQHVNMDSRTNLWNPPRFQSQTSLDTNSEILNTNPLNAVYPHQEPAYDRNHSDMFASPFSGNPYQYGSNLMESPHEPQIQPPIFLDTDIEIFSPQPLNVVYPNQESPYRHILDMFSSSPNPNQDQDGPEPTRFSEVTTEEDGPYNDGRTHSLPRKQSDPYTCPKCDGVFDTSQKFAAHMSTHYKDETKKEREERLRARNKRKFRNLIQHESQKKKKIILENGESSGGINVAGQAFKYPVVAKKEPL